jgi:hypothetical protein
VEAIMNGRTIGLAMLVGAVALAAALATGQDAPRANGPGADEADLRGKVVYIVTRPVEPQDRYITGFYEQVETARLAGRMFVVGRVPDMGATDAYSRASRGKRVWTPIEEVVQMTEFDSLDEAKQFLEAAREVGAGQDDP